MSNKFLVFGSKDGPKYSIPAELIAKDRAKYYSNQLAELPTALQEEFDYAMANDEELIDWAGNNMNLEDFLPEEVCLIIITNPPDIKKIWRDAWDNDDVGIVKIN